MIEVEFTNIYFPVIRNSYKQIMCSNYYEQGQLYEKPSKMGSTASKQRPLNRESTRCKIGSCLDPKDEENEITRVDNLQYARYNGHLEVNTDVKTFKYSWITLRTLKIPCICYSVTILPD
jgi:hypothetical protein